MHTVELTRWFVTRVPPGPARGPLRVWGYTRDGRLWRSSSIVAAPAPRALTTRYGTTVLLAGPLDAAAAAAAALPPALAKAFAAGLGAGWRAAAAAWAAASAAIAAAGAPPCAQATRPAKRCRGSAARPPPAPRAPHAPRAPPAPRPSLPSAVEVEGSGPKPESAPEPVVAPGGARRSARRRVPPGGVFAADFEGAVAAASAAAAEARGRGGDARSAAVPRGKRPRAALDSGEAKVATEVALRKKPAAPAHRKERRRSAAGAAASVAPEPAPKAPATRANRVVRESAKASVRPAAARDLSREVPVPRAVGVSALEAAVETASRLKRGRGAEARASPGAEAGRTAARSPELDLGPRSTRTRSSGSAAPSLEKGVPGTGNPRKRRKSPRTSSLSFDVACDEEVNSLCLSAPQISIAKDSGKEKTDAVVPIADAGGRLRRARAPVRYFNEDEDDDDTDGAVGVNSGLLVDESVATAAESVSKGALTKNLRKGTRARRGVKVTFGTPVALQSAGPAPETLSGARMETPTKRGLSSPESDGAEFPGTPMTKNEWSQEQLDAFAAQRTAVPVDLPDYWARVAAGVVGKSMEDCAERWQADWESPNPKNLSSVGVGGPSRASQSPARAKRLKRDAASTPEIAATMLKAGAAGKKTAKYKSNARRVAAAINRDVDDEALEPSTLLTESDGSESLFNVPLAGTASVATQGLLRGTPDTAAKSKRARAESMAAIQTPDLLSRGRSFGLAEADSYVAAFNRRRTGAGAKSGGTAKTGTPVGSGKNASQASSAIRGKNISSREETSPGPGSQPVDDLYGPESQALADGDDDASSSDGEPFF